MEVSKKDWKLYREKIGEWQENYMDRLCKEYVQLRLSASGRWRNVLKKIDADREFVLNFEKVI